MSAELIGVFPSGAIKLGPNVTCDGFHRDYGIRVQTHVHDDHMLDFETSKGLQTIYLTEATKRLLIAEFNADLFARQNLVSVNVGDTIPLDNCKISLFPSDHMLGSVQVAVELGGGTRVGYSGDFHWPIEKAMEVDCLVVDSTYGSPRSVRQYSQEQAEGCLLRLVTKCIQIGPVHIKAHRGTLHRAMQVLREVEKWPMIVSKRLACEVDVYRDFGYAIGKFLVLDSPDAKDAIKSGRYVRLYGKGDRFPVDLPSGVTIVLSAFASKMDSPVMEYSARSMSVALTDHADFDGVLEYVKATGAKYVVTDNSRGGHAVELAIELNRRLGITACPSFFETTREWGV